MKKTILATMAAMIMTLSASNLAQADVTAPPPGPSATVPEPGATKLTAVGIILLGGTIYARRRRELTVTKK